ncbi:ATP-dependent DNA helicase RecG [Breznakia sp. PF5-3]|uniref:ATP-dependent DNA helicase RecG n=1 Tax=unclassified Breznakia TaxID=2623764 RepID=UPI0024071EE5|nr:MULTISPECIES: ATP-dependent DNA helicase RecG [unclassified Breznakia]MDF9824665.1 ATP-dependent DNA helicase RecG [Breznakia sp. PM6-1]MDF9835650.1 ATP-dependent DNA helicase RecG [Breznakia sp. PF5-3]MDF9837685.1 ATP-dependent DNA helicase RecG [Breznakia sp. PFB2-8]MDF9859549.1 ATP-dependent DNA helicase RecG [Breznakia sp. PH5-24]
MDLKDIKVTPKKIEILNSMGIDSVESLITHYPFRYEENAIKPFSKWEKDEKVFFEGLIISAPRLSRFGYKKSVTRFKVLYDDEEINLTLFNRPWIQSFKLNNIITISGKYEGNNKVTVMQYNSQPIEEQLGIIPVYNVKDGISQKDLRKYMKNALEKETIHNFIPENLQKKYKLIHKQEALQYIHFPLSHEALKQSVRCLKYEEFLKFQLKIQYYRHQNEAVTKVAKAFKRNKINDVIDTLPFTLTSDQIQAIDDILNDLSSSRIMYRLIQGDVGSGKTLVAVMAMYACALAGQQAAFLAPTEILAKQHANNVKKVLNEYDINIELLYSSLPNKEKLAICERLEAGEIDILIGTHALFQDGVNYHNLGLVIADEQHRFGVEQRRKLLDKGEDVDFLLMSATPIPRTLATSLYGDMDVSTIEELPKGRKEIITTLVKENSMRSFLKDVLDYIDEGNQCYIVCPAIERNDEYVMRNVEELYKNMKDTLPSKYRLHYLHGKMSTEEKDDIMQAFVNKEFDILIATSVIEVGVDVRDANIMVIYDAQRFGMSQIHQLRGRVGRGDRQGYCYLLTNSKDPDSLKRLEILCESSDGFEISRQDLLIRGPGDLLGKRQSGIPGFILGDIIMDHNILDVAKEDAEYLLQHISQYPHIQKYISKKELTSFID